VNHVSLLLRIVPMFIMLFGHSLFAQSLNGFDLSNSLIDKKHIVQGGPPRDGIPAITEPHYVSGSDAAFLKADDIVLGLDISGEAFAYPRHILNWHEIVNDEVDGNAFVVSYCPLCGTGMAFSSKVSDQNLLFGVSGLLYNNDLLFYDKQSESLWSQIERRAISGSHVGRELKQLYLVHTSWQDWQRKHPKTKVLSEQQGFKRNYRHDPYTGYDTSSSVFFKTLREAPNEFHNKEKVLGLKIGSLTKAYPFSELRKHAKASFEDRLGDTVYQVVWNAQAESATIQTLQGETLTPTVAFWFAWYNFHPETLIFHAD